MTDESRLALARDLCSRATPQRVVERVAGIAFNFSSVTVHKSAADEKSQQENPEPPKRVSGVRPAFR